LRQERDTIHLEGSEAYAEVANWKVFAQLLSRVAALLAMPLYVAGEPYGGVILHYPHARQFTGEEIALAGALVSHAALAVENASLHSQVEQAAVASERARLAHELHDSVSQALYGIGLGVRTTLTLLSRLDLGERNREALQKPLDYAMSLAEGGLAEMRALIFGLRPDSLEKEGLVAAMERQAAAISARHELAVETAFCAEPEIAIEAKEALYRIAQEALNNVIKHAHAQNVVVTLAQEGAHLFLRVSDNGHGFDAEGRYPGHVGLQTMRERLSKFRGALTIESQPNAGTTICASLPVETA